MFEDDFYADKFLADVRTVESFMSEYKCTLEGVKEEMCIDTTPMLSDLVGCIVNYKQEDEGGYVFVKDYKHLPRI